MIAGLIVPFLAQEVSNLSVHVDAEEGLGHRSWGFSTSGSECDCRELSAL